MIESGTATPTPAWSWWMQTPWIFTGLSLRKKPWSGSNRWVRKPQSGHRLVGQPRRPRSTVVRT